MTKHVKISEKGLLALPADLLTRKGWLPGTKLEVRDTEDGVIVRPVSRPVAKKGFDYEAFRKAVPKHEGPSLTLEQMDEAIDRAMAERWARKEADSR